MKNSGQFKKNRIPNNYQDLSGIRFNHLIVIKRINSIKTKNGRRSVWRCKCDCGYIFNVSGSNIKRAQQCKFCANKVIGMKSAKKTRKPQGVSTVNSIYGNYKYRANKKGLSFELTTDQFTKLIFSPCFYCGRVGAQICYEDKIWKKIKYNGIDRKNSNIGYTLENCVTCCKTCNYGKRDLPFDEWIAYLSALAQYRSNL